MIRPLSRSGAVALLLAGVAAAGMSSTGRASESSLVTRQAPDDTTAPVTTAPVTTAPVSTAPATTTPATTTPVTSAPDTTAPATTAPATTTPTTTAAREPVQVLESGAGEAQFVQLGEDIVGEYLDDSGTSIAISNDGEVLAIGAPRSAADDPGLVRVFWWDGRGWTPHGAPIVGHVADGQFGRSVALSGDGRRVAVGNPNEGSDSPAGVVRVFTWSDVTSAWEQMGRDLTVADHYGAGWSVALAGDRLAVGSADNHIWVFEWDRSNAAWQQTGDAIVPPGRPTSPHVSVVFSANGNRLAAGAGASDPEFYGDSPALLYGWNEASATWVQLAPPAPIDDLYADPGKRVALSAGGTRLLIGVPRFGPPWVPDPGHAFVFDWDDARGAWRQAGGELLGAESGSSFGASVAISANGGRIAIGGPVNWASLEGMVRVYDWDQATLDWHQLGVDLRGVQTFGGSVAFSADGTHLAVGAKYDDANGVRSGVVRVYGIGTPSPDVPQPTPTLPETGAATTLLQLGGVLLAAGVAAVLSVSGRQRTRSS